MNDLLLQRLEQQLSSLSGKTITIKTNKRVYGGDINATYIIATNEGNYFVKSNHSAPPDMFQKEYNGLALLKEKSRLTIPQPVVHGVSGGICYLVMESIEPARFTSQIWQVLGEGLAHLHQQTQPQFGLAEDNYTGSLSQPNYLTDTWAEFYAAQRILPLIKKAFDANLCIITDVKETERLCNKLYTIVPEEPPSLLHGDLWNGNVMACANGKAAIYDPAVYYGHREMDIAMTLLFGGFDESFYHHYNAVYPLQNGWQQRVSLCQLYPLLVHLNLFGSGYYSRVKSVLKKYG